MKRSLSDIETRRLDEKLQLAVTHHRHGRLTSAQSLYEEILVAQPRHFDALHLCGVLAACSNDPSRAIELIDAALRVDAQSAAAHHNRGLALQALGRWNEALASFAHAASIEPAYVDAHFQSGVTLTQLGRWDAALAAYDRTLANNPALAPAHYNRANLLCSRRQWELALAGYDRALAIDRDYAEAYCSRSVVLHELQRLEDALRDCERAVAIRPDYAQAHVNRGALLVAMQSPVAAVDCYDRALAAQPGLAAARVGRAMAALAAGDLEQGFRDYESRWEDQSGWIIRERRNFAEPRWLGEESLSGKTLFLWPEQGLGDTLQFCRYALLAKQRGARVMLEAPRLLYRTLQTLPGIDQVIASGDTVPRFDYHCPLLSLPLAFQTTLETIPSPMPYLQADALRADEWKRKLGTGSRLRVGLVWAGGERPGLPELHSANQRRNIPLASLAVLGGAAVEFHSLQKGATAEAELTQAQKSPWECPPVVDFSADLTDFADTAALIAQLDLVISVDTATAHLAGAMAKPVWLLNRFGGCWRWLNGRRDTPWYPTLRLYTQPSRGDWDSVIAEVRRDLVALAASRRP